MTYPKSVSPEVYWSTHAEKQLQTHLGLMTFDPAAFLEECCRSAEECSSKRRTCWDKGIQTISHSPPKHTKLCTFIESIFVAAIAFNWSQSGPLPRAGADERAPLSTTLSTDFPGFPNNDPGRGQRRAITDAKIENFQFLTGFSPRICLPVTNTLVCWELLTTCFPFFIIKCLMEETKFSILLKKVKVHDPQLPYFMMSLQAMTYKWITGTKSAWKSVLFGTQWHADFIWQ